MDEWRYGVTIGDPTLGGARAQGIGNMAAMQDVGAKDARPMRTLGRYIMPLSLVVVAVDLAEQFLNVGIVRAVGPDDNETLAAFGLAYRLTRVCTSPLVMLRPVALVLVQTGKARRKVTRFALLLAALVAALLVIVARTPATLWLTGVGAGTREEAQLRLALVMLCGVPALDGAFRLYSGLLLRRHKSVVVSGASLADVVAQVSVVTTLLHATPSGSPLWIPIASLYAGRLAKCAVAVLAFHRPGAKAALAALPSPARPGAAAVAGPTGGNDGGDGSETPSPLLAPSRRLLELPHRAAGAAAAGGHAASLPASLAAPDRGGTGACAFVVPEVGSRSSGPRGEEAAQDLTEAGGGAVSGDRDGDGDGGGDDEDDSGAGELSIREVVSFMAPLAANEFIARLSRPLVNAVVASGADGTEEVAALTLTYPIAHLFYGCGRGEGPLGPARKPHHPHGGHAAQVAQRGQIDARGLPRAAARLRSGAPLRRGLRGRGGGRLVPRLLLAGAAVVFDGSGGRIGGSGGALPGRPPRLCLLPNPRHPARRAAGPHDRTQAHKAPRAQWAGPSCLLGGRPHRTATPRRPRCHTRNRGSLLRIPRRSGRSSIRCRLWRSARARRPTNRLPLAG